VRGLEQPQPYGGAKAHRLPQSGAGGSCGGRGLRPTPILFALLMPICFGGAVFSEKGALVLVVLGVMFVITAVFAWMVL
jgi:hypothetical protein